jgi:hypothetical protein
MFMNPAWLPGAGHDATRTLAATQLDFVEAAARGLTELEWLIARALPDPAGSVARACGDLARDATAVQLSTVRWILDL